MDDMDLKIEIMKTIEKNTYNASGDPINWNAVAYEFDFFEGMGQSQEGYYWEPFQDTDEIVIKSFKEDKNKAIRVFQYIFKRYNFDYDINFENYLNNEILFDENIENKLKLFISYSSQNEKIAKKVLDFYEDMGLDCFMAKNNIKISKIYKEEIFNAMLESNIFILILDEYSKNSDWCSQEAGIAYLKHKKVNALIYCITPDDTNPYGFLNSLNGKPFKKECLWEIINEIDEELQTDLKGNYYRKKIDELIIELKKSLRYDEARDILIDILKNLDFITQEQVDSIMITAIENNQIYEGSNPQKRMNKFIEIIEEDEDLTINKDYKNRYYELRR